MTDAGAIADGLQGKGFFYLSAICIGAMPALFVWLMRVQHLRIADRDKMQLTLNAAADARVKTAESVLPVAQQLAQAVVALERQAARTSRRLPPILPPEKPTHG